MVQIAYTLLEPLESEKCAVVLQFAFDRRFDSSQHGTYNDLELPAEVKFALLRTVNGFSQLHVYDIGHGFVPGHLPCYRLFNIEMRQFSI